MSEGPRTTYVFLDAEVYDRANYDFGNDRFSRVQKLAQGRELHLLTHEVTIQEVECHIHRRLDEAVSSVQRSVKKHYVVRIANDHRIKAVEQLDAAPLVDQVKSTFRTFLKDSMATSIALSDTSVQEVCEWYWNTLPPFGQGKKKAEFPDAFILSGIDSWHKRTGSSLYIVSQDDDLRKACEARPYCFHVASIEELLGEFHPAEEFAEVNLFVEEHWEDIKEAITAEFLNATFIVDQPDGEAEDPEVHEVDFVEWYCVGIDEDEAIVDGKCRITFEVHASWLDPDTGMWDSEDKVMLFQETTTATVQNVWDTSVQIRISWDPEGGLTAELQSVAFYPKNEVWVDVYTDE